MDSSPKDRLYAFNPQHPFFVGIDSDGCVFDSMEIKHKECFIPNIIKYWKLQAISKYARAASSSWNMGLAKSMDMAASNDPNITRTASGLSSA